MTEPPAVVGPTDGPRHHLKLRSIPGAVAAAAARWPDAEGLVDGDSRWTFAELEREMRIAVRATMALGVAPGDRVALLAPNCAEWVVAALGILGSGAVLVPVNTRFRGEEIAHVLRTSGARALIVADAWAAERLAGFKVPRRVIIVEALPRNASAKVRKNVLRELL